MSLPTTLPPFTARGQMPAIRRCICLRLRQQFTNSFVRGFGYSLGVATTYALFSNIDWDDDDDHHHDHDDDHHGGYSHNGDNININVNNFNKITGEHRTDNHRVWQHNPAYRNGVPYANSQLASRYHQTSVRAG